MLPYEKQQAGLQSQLSVFISLSKTFILPLEEYAAIIFSAFYLSCLKEHFTTLYGKVFIIKMFLPSGQPCKRLRSANRSCRTRSVENFTIIFRLSRTDLPTLCDRSISVAVIGKCNF